jgi:hypothetical protein
MDIKILLLWFVFYTIPALYLIYRTSKASNVPLGYWMALFPVWNIVMAILVFKKQNKL